MQVGFLDVTSEVGRIEMTVKTEKTQIVCDYGIMLGSELRTTDWETHQI